MNATNNTTSLADPEGSFIPHTQAYRERNLAIGSVGVILNVVALPVICRHDDLSSVLKTIFASMATADLLLMAPLAVAGLIRWDECPTEDYVLAIRRCSQCVYLASNITCLVMTAIATERLVTLKAPRLLRWFDRSTFKVACVMAGLWATGILLSVASFACCWTTDTESTTPMAMVTDAGLALQTAIYLSTSLAVCIIYSSIVYTLCRHTNRFACAGSASSDDSGGPSTRRPSSPESSAVSETSTAAQRAYRTKALKFRRATVHTAVLAVWFCVAYVPFGLYYLWVLASGTDRKAEIRSARITMFSTLPLFNSLIDPFILLWRLEAFRALYRCIIHIMVIVLTKFLAFLRQASATLARTRGPDSSHNSRVHPGLQSQSNSSSDPQRSIHEPFGGGDTMQQEVLGRRARKSRSGAYAKGLKVSVHWVSQRKMSHIMEQEEGREMPGTQTSRFQDAQKTGGS